jgi:putative FmdB family regulatory protein
MEGVTHNMPLYEFECTHCGLVFECITDSSARLVPCEACGSKETKKLIGAPAICLKRDEATSRIEKRVKNYLLDGKIAEATRFADKAASMVKSDRVKRIADKLHTKTGK